MQHDTVAQLKHLRRYCNLDAGYIQAASIADLAGCPAGTCTTQQRHQAGRPAVGVSVDVLAGCAVGGGAALHAGHAPARPHREAAQDESWPPAGAGH